MKLVQAIKQQKELARKRDDLIAKIKLHCADMDFESPIYGEKDGDVPSVIGQTKRIAGWVQSIFDINKEILKLRIGLQKTNLVTMVTITLGDKNVTKSIAEWIHRRKELAAYDAAAYLALTDRNLRDSIQQSTQGQPIVTKVRRYFDSGTRDTMVALFRSEPHIIDEHLEIANANTDVIE